MYTKLMIYDKHNETHDKYIQAMKSLDAHNMTSEYKKVPETREEIAFAQETNAVRSTSSFGLNIDENKWNMIFGEHEINEMD